MNYLKKIFMRGSALPVLIATIVALGAVPVLAQTPDTETPANEGVCDELLGATPGLYGLCVAYCEAQDLDDEAKEPPNTKILANYEKKRRVGDPDMPCVQSPCPCWSNEQLARISADGAAAYCYRMQNSIVLNDNGVKRYARSAYTLRGGYQCQWVDTSRTPFEVVKLSITMGEQSECKAQVEAACLALGL